MAPYSAKSLLNVEMQHLRLMYPISRRLVSSWLVEHAHAATSEYDSNPTSLRHMSRGSLPNRQSEVAADLQLLVDGASLVLITSNTLLSPPFPLCESSAGRAALLSPDTGVAAPPKSMVMEDALPLPSLPLLSFLFPCFCLCPCLCHAFTHAFAFAGAIFPLSLLLTFTPFPFGMPLALPLSLPLPSCSLPLSEPPASRAALLFCE